MAIMIKRGPIVPIGLMVAVLAGAGAAGAQINPATAQNSAKAAANVAGQTGAQSSNQPAKPSSPTSTPTKPAGQSTTTTKSAGQNSSTVQIQKPAPKTSSTQTPAGQKDQKSATNQAAGNTAAAKTAPVKTAPATQTQAKQTPASTKKTPARTPPAPVKQTQTKPAPAPAKQSVMKPAPVKTDVKPAGEEDAAEVKKATPPATRRDPFITLIGKQTSGGSGPARKLPPGKAGLEVSTLILQGIVSGPNGMIAVVANPQRGVYFLREGDALFDGRVEHINMDAVTFHEVGKDAFGNPVEREVTKKLNPSSGEQP
ncbi:MAG TPA: hypothetical protein VN774_05395 [Candidatus Limnocylindrales bacterium]|nr:hypothetical protein [Candidatus Limnocylindrales bacterium]